MLHPCPSIFYKKNIWVKALVVVFAIVAFMELIEQVTNIDNVCINFHKRDELIVFCEELITLYTMTLAESELSANMYSLLSKLKN